MRCACAEPAVDGERGSVDVCGVLGHEERDRGGDLVGPPDPPGGDGLLEVVRDVGGHVGVDDAGRHRVDGDALAPHLARERAREAEQAGLGGGVVRLARVAALGDDGRDVHDAAPAGLEHVVERAARAVEGAVQVDVDDVLPLVGRHADREAVLAHAGVVDEDEHGSEALAHLLEGGHDLLAVGDVGLHVGAVASA